MGGSQNRMRETKAAAQVGGGILCMIVRPTRLSYGLLKALICLQTHPFITGSAVTHLEAK